MKRASIITLLLLFNLVQIPAISQTLRDFVDELSLLDRDENSEFARYVNVEIRKSTSSTEALDLMIEQSLDEKSGEVAKVSKQGYRVGLFFDNSSSARAKAINVVNLCDSLLADIPVSMSYANPYFKVSAGYCVSQEEAVIMLHRIQRYFPNAYLMREEVTPSDLIKSYDAELELQRRIAEAQEIEDRKSTMPELNEFNSSTSSRRR